MRNLPNPIVLMICAKALIVSACTSSPVQPSQEMLWKDITRRDMALLDCGLVGGLPTRLNECATRNPAYSQHKSKSGHQWHLVMVDNQLRLEFWADQQTGSVWSNIFPYRPKICHPLGNIANGNREMRFMLATTVDYETAFEHPLPFPMKSSRARYFVLGDSQESGVVADEQLDRFRNVDSEELLWARCVAKVR